MTLDHGWVEIGAVGGFRHDFARAIARVVIALLLGCTALVLACGGSQRAPPFWAGRSDAALPLPRPTLRCDAPSELQALVAGHDTLDSALHRITNWLSERELAGRFSVFGLRSENGPREGYVLIFDREEVDRRTGARLHPPRWPTGQAQLTVAQVLWGLVYAPEARSRVTMITVMTRPAPTGEHSPYASEVSQAYERPAARIQRIEVAPNESVYVSVLTYDFRSTPNRMGTFVDGANEGLSRAMYATQYGFGACSTLPVEG